MKVSYEDLDSMIPVLVDDKFIANENAKKRAIKNGIKFNMLGTKKELIQMTSLVSEIFNMDDCDLKKLVYNKFKYLGFSAQVISLKKDMTPKQQIACFASNYMALYDTSEETIKKIIRQIKED